MSQKGEVFISIHVDTSGPILGEHSMLTFAGCVAERPNEMFSWTLRPISENSVPESLALKGRSESDLGEPGTSPENAMDLIGTWIRSRC